MPVCICETQQKNTALKERNMRVCFVCTGNTCRSPMAAAVANFFAHNQKKDAVPIVALSAGLYANDGEPIAFHAIEALEKAQIMPIAGMDYHSHVARPLTEEIVADSDLLIGLGGNHCMELFMRYPQEANKIVGMPVSIADPYGGDSAVYDACLEQIIAGVRQLLFSSEQTAEDQV